MPTLNSMKPLLLLLALGLLAQVAPAADKKIVFIAGKPSHGPGQHEHRAGCLLLKACLDHVPGVTSVVYSNGWPDNPQAFAGAAAIVIYADGGPGHPLLQDDHLKTIGALMEKGVGLTLLHYAVEPTREAGEKELLDWVGGCFEVYWSVNPTWRAEFKSLPDHPVTRGVQPFAIRDEWYFHMRFRDGMRGVTPVLSAVPTPGTIKRDDGPHENNPTVRAAVERGDIQSVAWVAERPGGGRGFGYTGGHYHENWGNDQARKLVLNGILWTAGMDIPPDGVASTVTEAQLKANLDPKGN